MHGDTDSFVMYIVLLISETYITAGIMGGVTIGLILCDIFYIYKTYKKEEQRLKNKYGDEFLEQVTWFKKRKNDQSWKSWIVAIKISSKW